MIVRSRRSGLVILAVIALVVLTGLVAGCSDDEATTTTVSDSATDSTTTTVAATTDETTIVEGGKSLDDYEAEIPTLEEAIAADPTDIFALENLAVAHYQLGEYEEAVDAYLQILAIQEDAFTRNNLGNAYRDWGKADEAKAAYRKAMEDDPTLKYPYVNLAGLLKKEGDIQGAMEVLTEGAKHMSEEDQATLDAAEEQLTSTTTTT
jgi:tetratricopeptide (TPR) repeat protein